MVAHPSRKRKAPTDERYKEVDMKRAQTLVWLHLDVFSDDCANLFPALPSAGHSEPRRAKIEVAVALLDMSNRGLPLQEANAAWAEIKGPFAAREEVCSTRSGICIRRDGLSVPVTPKVLHSASVILTCILNKPQALRKIAAEGLLESVLVNIVELSEHSDEKKVVLEATLRLGRHRLSLFEPLAWQPKRSDELIKMITGDWITYCGWFIREYARIKL